MAAIVPLQGDTGKVRGYRVRYWRPDGTATSKTFTGKGALEQARAFVAEIESAKRHGNYVDPSAGRVTLERYGEESWRPAQLHRPNTAERVRITLGTHVYPHRGSPSASPLGARPIAGIRATDLQGWVTRRARAVSAATLEGEWQVVRAVFAAAVADRIIGFNPCDAVTLPAVARVGRPDPPAPAVVDATAALLPARWRRMVPVMYGTGLRPSEARGLTVGQLHLLERPAFLIVDRQAPSAAALRADPTLTSAPPKTASSSAPVFLAPGIVAVIAAQLAALYDTPPAPDALVFPSPAKRWYTARTVQEGWNRACARAGLEGVHLHDLRHLYASLLFDGQASPVEVQHAVRHARLSTTTDVYAHKIRDRADTSAGIIERALTEPRASRTRHGEG